MTRERTSEKLRRLLREAGYEVTGQIFGLMGYGRRLDSVERWQAEALEVSSGQTVGLCSYDTMTDCCRLGLTVMQPVLGDLHINADWERSVYAGLQQQGKQIRHVPPLDSPPGSG